MVVARAMPVARRSLARYLLNVFRRVQLRSTVMPRVRHWILITAAIFTLPTASQAVPEYNFTLVDAFITTYDLRECYIYDINDSNLACGTATIQIGSTITYSGFYWSPVSGKTAVSLSWPKAISDPGLMA